MTQLEMINQALELMEPCNPDDPLDVAIFEVLNATKEVKEWEQAEGDVAECECRQCLAASKFAEAIIQEEERLNER